MSTFKTVNDAALQLKLTPQQVRTLCRNSKIQAEKIGNTWVIHTHSLSSYQNKRSFLAAENRTVYHNQEFKSPIALSFFSGAKVILILNTQDTRIQMTFPGCKSSSKI